VRSAEHAKPTILRQPSGNFEVVMDWSIFAAALGGGAARAALFEYRDWKARRREIPLDFNPKTGVYEADWKLKRWERAAKIGFWALVVGHLAFGYLMVINYPVTSTVLLPPRTSQPTAGD